MKEDPSKVVCASGSIASPQAPRINTRFPISTASAPTNSPTTTTSSDATLSTSSPTPLLFPTASLSTPRLITSRPSIIPRTSSSTVSNTLHHHTTEKSSYSSKDKGHHIHSANKSYTNDHHVLPPVPSVCTTQLETHIRIHTLLDSVHKKKQNDAIAWSASPSKTTHPRRSSLSSVATFVSSRGAFVTLLLFVCVVLGTHSRVSKHGVKKTAQLVNLHVEGILSFGRGNGNTVVAKVYHDENSPEGVGREEKKAGKKEEKTMKKKKNNTKNSRGGGISRNNNVDGFSFSRRDRALLIKHSFILKVGSNATKNSTGVNNDKRTARQNKISKRGNTTARRGTNKVEHRQVVLMTIASRQVAHFLLNLRCYTEQTSRLHPVLFALDENMTRFADAWNVPSIAWYNAANTAHGKNGTSQIPMAPFGSKAFSQVSNTKLVIVYQVLRLGFDILLTDVDIVWCTDLRVRFSQMLAEYPDVDVFMQSNRKTENGSGQVNTGFYYAKATKGSIDMFKAVVDIIPDAVKRRSDDQTLFYNTACAGGHKASNATGGTGTTQPRLMDDGSGRYETFCDWKFGRCKLMFLPLYEFLNGAVEPRNETTGEGIAYRGVTGYLGQQCKEKKISVWHANWIRGDGKRYHMIRQRLWILRDNYTCGTL